MTLRRLVVARGVTGVVVVGLLVGWALTTGVLHTVLLVGAIVGLAVLIVLVFLVELSRRRNPPR